MKLIIKLYFCYESYVDFFPVVVKVVKLVYQAGQLNNEMQIYLNKCMKYSF